MIGTRVTYDHARAWLAALAPHLHPGEAVTALSRTTLLRPNCDAVAVTTRRVLAFNHHETARGAKRQVAGDDIARAEIVRKAFAPNTLVVTTRSGEDLSFGDIPAADQETVLDVVRHLATTGAAPAIHHATASPGGSDGSVGARWDGMADELGKLAALRDQGVLTDGEFHGAKQRVLAQYGRA